MSLVLELWAVRDKGQESCLDWSHSWWECKIGSLGICFTLAEAVLEDAVNDATNTEGGLNDVRNEFLLLSCLSLYSEGDHLFGEDKLLACFGGDSDCVGFGDLSCKVLLDLLVGILEKV